VIGLSFWPALRLARRLADRIVYGRRATPYEVLADFSHRVAGSFAAEDVLPRMAQILSEAVGAERAVVWLRVGDELRPTGTWPSADAPDPVQLADDALPTMPADLAAEVRGQGELLGALAVTMSSNDPMTPSRERLVRDLAAQAGLVLRNVRLIEELRASRQRLVVAQDQERRKLERNIHDGSQQQLVALSVKIRLIEQLVDRDPGKVRELLESLQLDAAQALEDLRDLARGIYPPLLADRGLSDALRAQARKLPIAAEVRADDIGRYPPDVEATIYFCVLEALNNIAKYADAERVRIDVGAVDGDLIFTVADDGVGFDRSVVGYGTGLQGMADRLDAIGGSLLIESEPGRGTTIVGRAPVGAALTPDPVRG
jgi:signal transduction histidine kinase